MDMTSYNSNTATNAQADSNVGNTKCELKPSYKPHLAIISRVCQIKSSSFIDAVQCHSGIYRFTKATVHTPGQILREGKETVPQNLANMEKIHSE